MVNFNFFEYFRSNLTFDAAVFIYHFSMKRSWQNVSPKTDPGTMLQIRQKGPGAAEKTMIFNWTISSTFSFADRWENDKTIIHQGMKEANVMLSRGKVAEEIAKEDFC